MNIKTVTYPLIDGTMRTVEYDADAPCWSCGLPVGAASMGGTVICPACDCGRHRDGTPWTLEETIEMGENFKRSRAAAQALWDAQHPG